MAVIEWHSSAWQIYNDYLENAKLAYGKKTARRWEREIIHIDRRLRLFPTSFSPEGLLVDKGILYRKCQMMNHRFKLIYYYDIIRDIVHIVDIWDTRQDPQALIGRIP